ncbi:hypothetical protein FRB94_008129 [Tulasnella sp. JGI-2019a]|nr:hypothetical protein FRB94_008129 [Tulasnella sp. JGI-2019a]KAG9017318.1 hypothetical protein FRB93_007432 [Tulasnella sp. JGI-2019a]KAG9026459.1 hypothetical protein FRB95_008831 [Tulasnella sp. JGI-2019a]
MVALELDLRPGHGLGAFELGASLWTILEFLQHHTQKTIHPQVDIKYDTTSPANSPVVLHIKPHLDLIFSPSSQRLTLISLHRLRAPGTSLIVKYKEKIISSNSSTTGDGKGTVFRRGGVNQVFGPTYVGELMRYPGVWFGFEEDGVGGTASGVGNGLGHGKDDRNQEVKRIVITQRTGGGDEGVQELDALDEPLECPEMYGDLRRAVIGVDSRSSTPFIDLSFYLPPTTTPSNALPIQIRLGETTVQDLIADIGSPLRVHYKEDDRMQIYRKSSPMEGNREGEGTDDEAYFYNYFQYGMDFLIDGVTHTVRKVVLHSNVPGSHLFQRYKRCPWEIETPSKNAASESVPSAPSSLPVSSLLSPASWPYGSGETTKPTKKNKKKGSGLGATKVLVEPMGGDPESATAEPHHGTIRSAGTVCLFDKIDDIRAALSNDASVPPSPFIQPKGLAIPVKGTGASSPPSKSPASTAILSRSPASYQYMSVGANPASPPKMMLDRTSDAGTGDAGTLAGAMTQLIGFDGLVLEASELGDVLSVVVF